MTQPTHNEPLDPEVQPKAKRRKFPHTYKLDILEKADSCTKSGEIEVLLRREGLYSSHLAKWRQLRTAGELIRPSPKKGNVDNRRTRQLETEVEQLRKQLQQAQSVIEIQKKLSDLLDSPLGSTNRMP